MKKHPIWWLIIGIAILIIPTGIYLAILMPKMSEQYNILLTSGGIIGAGGFTAVANIPEDWKCSSLMKTAGSAFTVLCTVTLVQQFWYQIIGLIATAIVSYIIYKIFKELWKNGKQKLAEDRIVNGITQAIKESAPRDTK